MMAFLKGCDRFLRTMFFVLFCFTFLCHWRNVDGHNYRDALQKAILFFEGQRSGRLLEGQRINWRGNSGLLDGRVAGVDLTGGYYDAGDNVKFNFPMAFTATMLSWSAIEYGDDMGDQLESTRTAIKWATDYLLKCAQATPGKLYVGVGEPNIDHSCWERPEDMDTVRSVYFVSESDGGSDVAGETAAALAAASIVFQQVDPDYSNLLLETAKKVMEFAVDHQRKYTDVVPAESNFYSSSGYNDELLWGAAWLLQATDQDMKYLNYIQSFGVYDVLDDFTWDNKFVGAYVLLSQQCLMGKGQPYQRFVQAAEEFICKIPPNSPSKSMSYTQGGLMFKSGSTNLQHVTAISFLLTTYAKYMAPSGRTFKCGNSLLLDSKSLTSLAKTQVDYILGTNPRQMSYMVGYGSKFPQKIHHRGSSLPSRKDHPEHIECGPGFAYLDLQSPNPNMLTGAIVGGPAEDDSFEDNRRNSGESEPTTYINAPFVGTLAYFAGNN